MSLFLKTNIFLMLEVAAMLCIVAALSWIPRGRAMLLRLEHAARRVARYRKAVIFVAAVLPIVLRLALLPMLPAPIEASSAKDEYAYMLNASTFVSGRLSNPPHPLWRSFESPHVLQRPVHIGKFHTGQSLILAAGKILGHPWIGIVLSIGLMCAAASWCLYQWVPPYWALIGTVLIILRIGVVSYWMNTFWGGALAAVGGALVIGSIAGILRGKQRSIWLGVGLVLLMLTRPAEGLFFALPAILAGGWYWSRSRSRLPLTRIVLPPLTVLVIGFAWLGVYNAANTGSPARMPYQLYLEQYQSAPAFSFLPAATKQFNNNFMRRFHDGYEMAWYEWSQNPLRRILYMLSSYATFFWGPALAAVVLFMSWWVARDRRIRIVLIATVAAAAVISFESFHFPHYSAPLLASLYIIAIQSLRHLAVARPVVGRAFTLTLPVLIVGLVPVGFFLMATGRGWVLPPSPQGWCCRFISNGREPVSAALRSTPGTHLVFVRQPVDGPTGLDYVYNEPEIDRSRIVWARELDEEQNRAVRAYYPDRTVWLLDTGRKPLQAVPYTAPVAPHMEGRIGPVR